MSIRQFRPKVNSRRGVGGFSKIWLSFLLALLIALEIAYPLVNSLPLLWVTLSTVIVGAFFAFFDAKINYGSSFAVIFFASTIIFGFLIEQVGQVTNWPFGKYSYDSSLGFSLAKVPLIVPLAWVMMSYPVFIVSRRITKNWVFILGGFGLAAWDLFLDPQMVRAGRWHWQITGARVPFENNIPLSNFFGWLFSGMILMALLHLILPKERRKKTERTKHTDFFILWVLFSGIVGNIFFFNSPGVAFIGGLAFLTFSIRYFYISFLGIPDQN